MTHDNGAYVKRYEFHFSPGGQWVLTPDPEGDWASFNDVSQMADEIVPLALTVLSRWRDSLPDAPERLLAEACERWLAEDRHYGNAR